MKSSHFVPLLLNFLLIILAIPQWVYGRIDDDTEAINTSFKNKTKNLLGDEDCQIQVNDKFVDATAIVEQPFKMPKCLMEFYENAHLGKCGKPMYNKFAYCAKALHFDNTDYTLVDPIALQKKYKFLVLIDGCVICERWPERGVLLVLHLKHRDKKYAVSRSDAYGDYKIGAIFELDKKERQFQPELEILHTCNQYTQFQTMVLKLPVLYRYRQEFMRYEAKHSVISLAQGGKTKFVTMLYYLDAFKKSEKNDTVKADDPDQKK